MIAQTVELMMQCYASQRITSNLQQLLAVMRLLTLSNAKLIVFLNDVCLIKKTHEMPHDNHLYSLKRSLSVYDAAGLDLNHKAAMSD